MNFALCRAALLCSVMLSLCGGPRAVAQLPPAAGGSTSAPSAAAAQSCAPPTNERADPLPPELQGVGIDEHLNAPLPLDAQFTDSTGQRVTLRDYFDGKHPVVLTLNYYRCPML